RRVRQKPAPAFAETPSRGRSWVIAAAVLIVAALALGGFLLSRRSAPVASGSGTTAVPAATPVTTAAAVPEKTIAVLPFEKLNRQSHRRPATGQAFACREKCDRAATDLGHSGV